MSYVAIGTMSGTSCDGVDAAAIETDGINHFVAHPEWCTYSKYTAHERQVLLGAMHEANTMQLRMQASAIVTNRHTLCIQELLTKVRFERPPIIGFHGQTILHQPDRGITLQIGDGAKLAQDLNLTVVGDFRSQDMALGGQGAPLAPIGHLIMARTYGHLDAAFLNVGGVANITLIPPSNHEEDLLACDIGPGMALMDDFMLKKTGQPFDKDGALASTGSIIPQALQHLKDDLYFKLPPPKSLDRNHFHARAQACLNNAPIQDALATLAAFSGWCVEAFLAHIPTQNHPKRLIVCGGGSYNKTFLKHIPLPYQQLDWKTDFLEAHLFGILAIRTLLGLPISFPRTTGVPTPTKGGKIWNPIFA